MPQYKHKVGKSYEVTYRNCREALVNFTYNCPYCSKETTVGRSYVIGLDILGSKAFSKI